MNRLIRMFTLLVVTAALGGVGLMAALATEEPPGRQEPVPPGMMRMHELMKQGNPGMMRMHELMVQGNPGMAHMHELIMPSRARHGSR